MTRAASQASSNDDIDYVGTNISTETQQSLSNEDAFVGDILALSAALAFGLVDTVSEYYAKNCDPNEYLGMLGLFGMLITGFVFPFFDLNSLMEVSSMSGSDQLKFLALLGWNVLSVATLYTAKMLFLRCSDVTLLELSFQTSSLWATVFSLMLEVLTPNAAPAMPNAAYYWSVVLVFTGVYTYEILGKSSKTVEATNMDHSGHQSEAILVIDTQTERQQQGVVKYGSVC